MKNDRISWRMKSAKFIGAISCLLMMAGCAGAAGNEGGQQAAGFEFKSDQEAVDSTITDLDPIEIVYQPGAKSQSSPWAEAPMAFKEEVEARSDGKIAVEIVWGQAIAGFSEVDDALADGRLDIAETVPLYDPSAYPAFDAMTTSLSGLPTSPVQGEAIYGAVATDVAWNTPELLAEYADKQLTPLIPINNIGNYHFACGEYGSEGDDWNGRQVRTPSTSHADIAESMGATPVFMEHAETWEGLQRNTVDCTVTQILAGMDSGIFEVAPHLVLANGDSSLSRGGTALVAGSSFESFAIPYQQIIFDASMNAHAAMNTAISAATSQSIGVIQDSGGEIVEVDSGLAQEIANENRRQREAAAATGLLGDDVDGRIKDAVAKWEKVAHDLGVIEGGPLVEIGDWYSEDAYDFLQLSEEVYRDVAVAHRPE